MTKLDDIEAPPASSSDSEARVHYRRAVDASAFRSCRELRRFCLPVVLVGHSLEAYHNKTLWGRPLELDLRHAAIRRNRAVRPLDPHRLNVPHTAAVPLPNTTTFHATPFTTGMPTPSAPAPARRLGGVRLSRLLAKRRLIRFWR